MEITIKLANLITVLISIGIAGFIIGAFTMALLRMSKTADTATDLFMRMDEADRIDKNE